MDGSPHTRTEPVRSCHVSRERPPLLERPPPPVGVALPMLADVLFTSRPSQSRRQLSRLGTFGLGCVGPPALSRPELCGGRAATSSYCLPSLPAASLPPGLHPSLRALFPKSCSNHTPRFCPSPSSSSLPHSGWVGLKAGTNLTAASHS